MPAEVTAEAFVQQALICLRANGRADQRPPARNVLAVATHHMRGNVGEVRLAACQQVRPRLADQVLDARGDEKGERVVEGQTHPPGVQLPEFALPKVRVFEAGARECRNPYGGHDGDYDARRDQADGD